MNWKAGLFIVAVVAAGALFYVLNKAESDAGTSLGGPDTALQQPSEVQRETLDQHPEVTQSPLIPPPATLEESDAASTRALTDLSPRLTQWLVPDSQIRKWVMLVDQIADGSIPAEHRPLNFPMPALKTRRADDKLILDSSNYARADALIDTVTEISPARLAAYYRDWRPLLDEAYGALGRGGDFDRRLRIAIGRVLAVKPPPREPELKQPSVYYTFADERYEKASGVDKFMWRLGPENMLRVQSYLRQLEPLL